MHKFKFFVLSKFSKSFVVILIAILLIIPVYSVNAADPRCGDLCWVVTSITGFILGIFTAIFGAFLTMFMWLLLQIASYNDFTNAYAIKTGWITVRDISNMFFAVILLIIAFGTILQSETYALKKTLPKLILMAILVNFSKVIAGVFIDMSQVFTLTFVNSFYNAGPFSLTVGLHTVEWTKALESNSTISEGATNTIGIIASQFLALCFTIIAALVVLVLIVVFLQRIIMLWILVVLSPLPYVLSIIPAGQEYAKKWWSQFGKYCVNVPVLAFFLWLSLSMFAGADNYLNLKEDTSKNVAPNIGITEGGGFVAMSSYMVAIGMLIGSLMVAQEIGGVAGKAAGQAYGAIQSGNFLMPVGFVTQTLATKWANKTAVQKEKDREAGKESGWGTKLSALGSVGLMALSRPQVATERVIGGIKERIKESGESADASMIGIEKAGGHTGGVAGIMTGGIAKNWYNIFTGATRPQELEDARTEYEKYDEANKGSAKIEKLMDEYKSPATTNDRKVAIQSEIRSIQENYKQRFNNAEIDHVLIDRFGAGEYHNYKKYDEAAKANEKVQDLQKEANRLPKNSQERAVLETQINTIKNDFKSKYGDDLDNVKPSIDLQQTAQSDLKRAEKRTLDTTMSDKLTIIRDSEIKKKYQDRLEGADGNEYNRNFDIALEENKPVDIKVILTEAATKDKLPDILNKQGFDATAEGLQKLMQKLEKGNVLDREEAHNLGFKLSNLAAGGLGGAYVVQTGRKRLATSIESDGKQAKSLESESPADMLKHLNNLGGTDINGVFQFSKAFLEQFKKDLRIAKVFTRDQTFDKIPHKVRKLFKENSEIQTIIRQMQGDPAISPLHKDYLRDMQTKLGN